MADSFRRRARAGAGLCVLLLLGALAPAACARPGMPERSRVEDPMWQTYAALFITPSGRVVDTGNEGISHSEGQSWGLLLAVAHGDRERFDRLWHWTHTNLGVRSDRLLAWRYDPAAEPPVRDRNNASDGDLMVAWAMWRAWERWGDRAYLEVSRRLREDIQQHLVRTQGGYTVLLPGRDGFVHGDSVYINLSYLIMPALRDFSVIDPDGPWAALIEDGRRLLEAGRTGEAQLPPDWLALDASGNLAPAPLWPPHFGYEAVRIPLYFIWGGVHERLNALCNINRLWTVELPPAWINVTSGEEAAFPLSAGGLAVRALMQRSRELPPVSRDLSSQDYYSASLTMLARQAMRERSIGGSRLLACHTVP